jgi:hypothetical protein
LSYDFLGLFAEIIYRFWHVLEIAHICNNNKAPANPTAKDDKCRAIFTPLQAAASGTLPQDPYDRAYSRAMWVWDGHANQVLHLTEET